MTTNRILIVVLGILAIPTIPVQILTTLVLGIAVSITFGLLLFPISLIWMLLYFPMLGLSWVTNRFKVLRDIIGIMFLPWVVLADTFVALMPAMGELESRAAKLMLCQAWPFTWELSEFFSGRLNLDSAHPDSLALTEVLNRITRGNLLMQKVLSRVVAGESLDPDL